MGSSILFFGGAGNCCYAPCAPAVSMQAWSSSFGWVVCWFFMVCVSHQRWSHEGLPRRRQAVMS